MLNNLRTTLNPLVALASKPFMKIHPNILSFISFVVALPGFYFLAKGNTLLGSLFILGALFDTIDGAVARETGKTSKFGGVLDATLDRVFDGLVLFFLSVGQILTWKLSYVLVVVFLLISYIKAKAEAMAQLGNVGTNEFSVGFMQRGERLILLFLACFADYFITPNSHLTFRYTTILILVFAILTLFYRGVNILKNLK